jgi:hypothetical protein
MSDADYQTFERLVAERVKAAKGPLFTTDASGLFETYLYGLSAEHRQHYNCRSCQRFVEKYGGLVMLDEDGRTRTLVWGCLDGVFLAPSVEIGNRVSKAKVTGVYLSSDAIWGTPSNDAVRHLQPGESATSETVRWTHLHGYNPNVYRSLLKTAEQEMAEKREEHHMLCRGLAEYPLEAFVQAVRVLEADVVDRSEKTLAMARWLLDLATKTAPLGRKRDNFGNVHGVGERDNLIWLAVATAPPGWCHVKTGMLGTLLDDVVAGQEFSEIKRRWDAKMNPLSYQRPQVLKEGNVKQANALVERLDSAGSLSRRFARLSDVLAFEWQPKSEPVGPTGQPKCPKCGNSFQNIAPVGSPSHLRCASCKHVWRTASGAFDRLLPKASVKEVQLPTKKIGWDEFKRTVLPAVNRLEYLVPSGRVGFYGLITAANPDAPPILQWDGLTRKPDGQDQFSAGSNETMVLARNPVSWYFYSQGSFPTQWGMSPGCWVAVTAVFRKPCHWQREFPHQGEGIFFALAGCWDQEHKGGGGFFPETLKSEYHGIRQAMEAYAKNHEIAGKEEGDANGIALMKEQGVRVRVNGGQEYEVTL